jgi:hypothetical protein
VRTCIRKSTGHNFISHLGGFRPAKLLDWGEHPFPQLAGLAYDGKNLWALDNEANRICIIEKSSD